MTTPKQHNHNIKNFRYEKHDPSFLAMVSFEADVNTAKKKLQSIIDGIEDKAKNTVKVCKRPFNYPSYFGSNSFMEVRLEKQDKKEKRWFLYAVLDEIYQSCASQYQSIIKAVIGKIDELKYESKNPGKIKKKF